MILAIASCRFLAWVCFLLKFWFSMESLILAQDERWRRASYMQVEREARSLLWVESGERVRNT